VNEFTSAVFHNPTFVDPMSPFDHASANMDVFVVPNPTLGQYQVPALVQNDDHEPSSEPSSSLPVSPEQTRADTHFWKVALHQPDMPETTEGASDLPKGSKEPDRMLAIKDLVNNNTTTSTTTNSSRKRKAADMLSGVGAMAEILSEKEPFQSIPAKNLESILPKPKQPTKFSAAGPSAEKTTENLAQELKEAIESEPITAVPEVPVERPRKRTRMTSVAIGVGAFVAGSVSTIAALASLPEKFFI
jgi:hypothetical protein